MSSPDRRPVPETALPAAQRQHGTAPRTRAERLLMLCTLVAISLAVAIPTLAVSYLFGSRPWPKAPPPAVRSTPAPGDGLLSSLQRSADALLPDSQPLGPEPIVVPVRPEHIDARAEKVARQAAQFGGAATEGLSDANGKHLFVDLPATATAAFRRAVTNNNPAASPSASPGTAAAGSQDHVEVIIRPAGNDE